MKILLVLPANEKYRIISKKAKVPKRKMLRFSILPLTMVAASTPPEYDVEICDENVEPINMNTDAQIIGISFMSALAPRAYELAYEFRKRGKIVVAGGYHPTLCPEETKKHFDSIVVGDAEIVWPQLLKDIEQNKLKKIYQHKDQSELLYTPIPRRDLITKTSKYYITNYATQTGRGCNHNCKYCSITAFHKGRHRHRPVNDVIDELKKMPKNFIFVDDNIIGDPEYAIELFKKMIPLKKRWVSQCSLKIADNKELLQNARKAGCYGLFIGIESLSKENLTYVNKGFNKEKDLIERITNIRRAGIGIIAGIMVGMDFDDIYVFQDTMNFLEKAKVDAIQVNIMTPLPGTPLYKEMSEQGRIINHNLSDYDFRHAVIRPLLMSPEELQQGADWLYNEFYKLNRIIKRSFNAFFTLGPIQALLSWKLNMTYRYDNIREKIIGRNPAENKSIFVDYTIKSWAGQQLYQSYLF